MKNNCTDDILNQIITSYEFNYKSPIAFQNNNMEKIKMLIIQLRKVLLPEFFSNHVITLEELRDLKILLVDILHSTKDDGQADEDSLLLLKQISPIRKMLLMDIEAAYSKDPAATNSKEIALTYPGVFAIMVHRISHLLYTMGYNLLARILSEHAHSSTGIDIHPGATIGNKFFIDHGTGVVIGETSVIGNNVTIYQNVTIGAFSFQRNERGELMKGTKRHPTIEDNVTIYSGATILGGDTVVGKGTVIGGNVWLTESVLPNSKVISKFQNEILYPYKKLPALSNMETFR